MTNMTCSSSDKIIIGIDPGTRITGYGIVAYRNNQIEALDFGTIRPPPNALLSDRYLIIHDSLNELVVRFAPSVMAIETPFVNKNVQSALKLGKAQGAAIIAAKRNGLRIFGLSPSSVKQHICGTGKAHKLQIQMIIQKMLRLSKAPHPFDVADALAIAITYGNMCQGRLFRPEKYEL
jgi:crossover junction endodeoxyribonuclease RuvC